MFLEISVFHPRMSQEKTLHPSLLEAPIGPLLDPEMLFHIVAVQSKTLISKNIIFQEHQKYVLEISVFHPRMSQERNT